MTSEDAFVEAASAFLSANAKRKSSDELFWGGGSDRVVNAEERTPSEAIEWLRQAKEWKAREFDAGFGWITGPVEHGGRDLSATHERAYRELLAGYEVPDQSPFTISLGMVAPTIVAHGTSKAHDRYVRPLYRGDIVGCQLFSEPSAGSDLASVRTLARRDGDEWILTGQKVWTSNAQLADIGEVLCRTDTAAPKHKGLTAFVVDMSAPGVEVRPLRQMTGGSSFNEVFLEDVRVPDSDRLGAVDAGWGVALTTLMGERALGAGQDLFGVERAVDRLLLMVRALGVADDLRIRQLVADSYIRAKTIKYAGLRADGRRRSGLPPGPEESIFKLASTEVLRHIAATASQVLGPRLVADSGEWGTYSWSALVLGLAGMRIAAGTDEVMRNILAERVLGLPKDPVVRTPPTPRPAQSS